ncbi:MAG: flagellar biosynthesis anti-sigma factor FlgM [Pseudomonadota bacterium]
MKINDKIINYEISKHLSQSTQKTAEQLETKPPVDDKKLEGVDRSAQDTIVNLSPALKEAQAVKEIIASAPDVRAEKVAELKAEIESGEYQIDHQAVANKMVDSFIDEIS